MSADGSGPGGVSEDCEYIRAESEPDVIKKMADPRLPNESEVQKHLLRGHIPYRDWCPICVKSMGKSIPHRRSERERNVPEYGFDYCFPGDEMGFKWTVLVGKERLTGNFFATTVPSKGGKGRFDVNRIMEFIAECGDSSNDIILKSDQEPSMAFLLKEVMLERGSASDMPTAHGSFGEGLVSLLL